MGPADADSSGAGARTDPPGAGSGSLRIGGYVLEVGDAAGTAVRPSPRPGGEDSAGLEQALQERESRQGGAAGAAAAVDDASAATAKVERAVALGKGVAEGRALSPEQLALEVGTLLDLLERLDRHGRHEETLRLARALANLLMLLRRWAELLRTLRAALRAGERLGDLRAVAWAKHELGTLRLAAGDVAGAERDLREAREIRERIGDRRGFAATNRNLQVLCERLREMLREEELVRARGRRPPALRLLSLAVLSAFLFAAGVGAGVIAAGDGPAERVGSTPGTTPDATGATTSETTETIGGGTNEPTGGATKETTDDVDTFPLPGPDGVTEKEAPLEGAAEAEE